MTVIEGVEKLRELENMFGQVCWLGGGNALVDYVGSFRRREPQFPEFVAGFAFEIKRHLGGGNAALPSTESPGINPSFTKDAGGAHDRILRVRPGFAFEAERLFEIESDDGLLGEFQHEIA